MNFTDSRTIAAIHIHPRSSVCSCCWKKKKKKKKKPVLARSPRKSEVRLAEDTPRLCGPQHLTIPVALFFNEKQGGEEKTIDDAAVNIEILPNGQVRFAVGATVNVPETKFLASAKPFRCSERFRLVYVCE